MGAHRRGSGQTGYPFRKIHALPHDDRDSNSISNNYILTVIEDRTGAFWVGTNGGGLNLMDRKTGKFAHFLPWSIVTQLVEDAAGTLWVASTAGCTTTTGNAAFS
ncbi:two-component regulator propeller domain-containing protein [Salmonirosea aquatica]|uniref:two-component regulator propeller domain-containing protein n=1 Tax=Salmonirosea aquatica TaxID=2654236 RepID=UPI00128B15DC